MTAFNRTSADTAGGTDAATRTKVTRSRSASDTAGGTDSTTGVLALDLVLIANAFVFDVSGMIVPAVSMEMVPTPAGERTKYLVVAVDYFGAFKADFQDAEVTEVVWELNAPGSASFTIPLDDPNVSALPLANSTFTPHREVQIWRNGVLLWWGIPIKRRANSASRVWEYTAAGLLWYFTRRYVGEAERTNFITNPQAELGTADWTAVNCTFTDSTDQHILGTKSFRLAGSGSTDAYIYQRHLVTATTIGLALFVAAWLYLPTVPGAAPSDYPIEARGLTMLRIDPTTSIVNEKAPAVMNDSVPRNKWVRQEVGVWMPPNATELIEVRLYVPASNPPDNYAYWDAVQQVAQESVAFGGPPPDNGPWDQVEIAKEVVRYAQGAGFFAGYNSTKSNLNIGTAGAPSGIIQYRIYMFAEHQRIYTGSPGGSGVLDEWPGRVDGFDFDIETFVGTGASVRTFTCYYPRKGSQRPELALEWGGAIGTYSIEEDISATANEVIVLGDSNTTITSAGGGDDKDAAREEGGYTNPPALGGLTLGLVESAPASSPIDTLDHIARARGQQLEAASIIPTITISEPRDATTDEVTIPLIGVLKTGDVVPVRIEDADVSLNANFRVIRIALRPQEEQMDLTLNDELVGLPS